MQPTKKMKQQDMFEATEINSNKCKFVSMFRVSLIRHRQVPFNGATLLNAVDAQAFFRRVIETQGQPDREQFVIAYLDAKNKVIGINIVSTGSLTAATVHPREVLNPAILANACAMIFCHDHPSGDCAPSPEDIVLTEKLVAASDIMGITVHEHLIISMQDEKYFSFSDRQMIRQMYRKIKKRA